MRFPIPANTISRFLLICLSVLFSVASNAQGENNPPAGRGGEGIEGGGARSGGRGGFRVIGTGKVVGSSGNPISAATVTILYPKSIDQFEKSNANNFTWSDTSNYKRKKSTTSNDLGQYQINVNLRAFAPEGSDFSWMMSELQNPNSKAFYFLLVAQQNDGKITSQWLNLLSLVNLKQMPPPEGGFEFNIPDMILLNKEESMTAVEIKTQAVLIKGDTTEINANNYKVNPDATAEDLVGKMPGVSSSNGQIQAQGETVKKVLVDGKPFFGEDPNAALKNLPAEVVGKIQIYDAKSEQSLFSGIDDGNTTKTMNIITKSQFRNGLFGRGFAGIGQSIEGTGDQTKYKGGITINSFHGNRRLTFLSQINNINEQNFSFEDLMGSMGGGGTRGGGMGGMGGMGSRGGMGGGGNFFTGNQSGITTTRAIGLNYSNQWGKNVELSGSYFLTSTANINSTETNRNYIVGDPVNGTINYLETNPSNTDNLSHRANLRLNWKLDSTNSLLIEPKISFQQNTSENPLSANTINGLSETISRLSNFTNTQTDGYRASSSILYRHSFKKKGRTFSTEINPGINGQAGNTKLVNSNYFISDTTSRDQKTDLLKNTTTFSGNMTFTESLDSNNFIAATVSTNINQNNNDRLAYLMDAATLGYTRLDTFFSSKFINGYSQHKAGVSYRYQTYKWNITTSLDGQLALLDGQQSMPKNSDLSRQFTSLLPSFQARYNLGMKRNLRMNYNTSNNAPSIDQLQPVVNNNNTMQLSSGNPMLVQDYQHSLFLRYFSVTPESGKNVFWMINSQYSNNYISNKTILGGREAKWILMDSNVFKGPQSGSDSYSGSDSVLLSPGGQITIPVNVNGYYSLRLFGSWGKTIKKINVNTNAGITTSHIPSLIQMGNSKAILNYATNPSITAGLVLASNISEKIDFTVSGNGAYSQVVNSIQKSNNQTYINYNGRFAMNFMPTKKWVINSDVTYQAYQGLSSSFNQKYYLWNAGLGYKFMKGNAGELRLTAYDILNQNRSIQRNVTQTYYEDVRTKVLTRYLMITFTYKLRKFNGKGEDGKDMKMFFPGGMPPPGMPGHGMPGR